MQDACMQIGSTDTYFKKIRCTSTDELKSVSPQWMFLLHAICIYIWLSDISSYLQQY